MHEFLLRLLVERGFTVKHSELVGSFTVGPKALEPHSDVDLAALVTAQDFEDAYLSKKHKDFMTEFDSRRYTADDFLSIRYRFSRYHMNFILFKDVKVFDNYVKSNRFCVANQVLNKEARCSIFEYHAETNELNLDFVDVEDDKTRMYEDAIEGAVLEKQSIEIRNLTGLTRDTVARSLLWNREVTPTTDNRYTWTNGATQITRGARTDTAEDFDTWLRRTIQQ